MLTPQFPTVISSSSWSTFESCPQEFYLETILGQRLKETNFHLDAGKAYAEGLEVARGIFYHPANQHIEAMERTELAKAFGLERLTKSYGDSNPDPEGNMFHKSYERIVGAYIEYFIKYPMHSDKFRPMKNHDGMPALEFSFVFDIPGVFHPVTGDPLLYSGRADMMAELTTQNNSIWVFDDKTATQFGPTWRQQWELRSQFTGYVYGANQHGIKPAGVAVRGMRLPKTKTKADYQTEEVVVTRSPAQVNRWLDRLRYGAQRMVDCWNNDYWPHSGEENGGCNNYGGCAYRTLCTSANPERYIPVYYKTYRWDPVEGQEVEDLDEHPAIARKDKAPFKELTNGINQ